MTALKLLLDEHYPSWLADQIGKAGVDAVAINAQRVDLRGADDVAVLRAAAAEGRVVVTEDITTFPIAITHVPDHLGVIYAHPKRFPRTRPGINWMGIALIALAADPPEGLGEHPLTHWLASAD